MPTLRRIVTPQFKVKEIYKTKNYNNPLSGHSWTEETDFSHYEVDGTKFYVRYGNRLKAAIRAVKHCRELNAYYKAFPRHILMDQKQFDNALRYSQDMTGWYSELVPASWA